MLYALAFTRNANVRSVLSESLLGISRAGVAVLIVTLIFSIPACSMGALASESCGPGEIGTSPDCFPAPPAGNGWRVVFSEEFDGSDYDHGKLTPCFDWNYGNCTASFNEGRETYKPEQVRVSDGTAKLVAEPLWPPEPNPACYQDECTYKAGLLSTARPNAVDGQYLFPFTYGYVESRLKFPDVSGFFTAFWMVPTDPETKYRSEIDIAEVLGGDPKTVYMSYFYDDRNHMYRVNTGLGENGACPVQNYSGDWVRFGVDWQPHRIAWYINGLKCGEFTDSTQIENGPMQLILMMTVDNDWERDVGSVLADQSAVAQLEVDYIRVYQQR